MITTIAQQPWAVRGVRKCALGLGAGIYENMKPSIALKRGLGGGAFFLGIYGAWWTFVFHNGYVHGAHPDRNWAGYY
jgi:hypothetical protein